MTTDDRAPSRTMSREQAQSHYSAPIDKLVKMHSTKRAKTSHLADDLDQSLQLHVVRRHCGGSGKVLRYDIDHVIVNTLGLKQLIQQLDNRVPALSAEGRA